LSAEIDGLSAQIEPAERELSTLETQAEQLESDLASTRQRLSELQALYNEQLLEKERRHDDLKSLEQRIEDELGAIEYPAERVQQLRLEFIAQGEQILAPIQVLPESVSSDISELKARMRRLGTVNPNAPLQYRELRERHDFLEAQVSDLQQSATSLQHVVSELDKVMEEEFLSVFNVAAKEFSSYFQILFDGGKAVLSLSDPDNPTTSGVEIDAQPPGRRPQSLAMLSGGERALTATALLFSVLKARPLPFCLLDEVDAMLDEANVGRFRALLENFSRQTQFIVITHNRRTIESAKTIYGVSMSEEGVSQVLSLKLREEQRA
jgi:chromosome segregation protein